MPSPQAQPATPEVCRAISAGVRELFPAVVGVGVVSIASIAAVSPVDASANSGVEDMGNDRRRSFIAGRIAARDALASIGRSAPIIGRGPDGHPLWPDGVSGSVSHSRDLAVAVVTVSAELQSVGVDIEALDDSSNADERRLTPSPAPELRLRTAQEASFKAMSAIDPRAIGSFLDVRVRTNEYDGGFTATIAGAARSDAPTVAYGRWALIERWILASAWVPSTHGHESNT